MSSATGRKLAQLMALFSGGRSAAAYVAAKRRAEDAAGELDGAKAALLELVTHSSETGCGVSVTRYWKTGNVDCKKIPEFKGIDLEQFRNPPRLETRISVAG